MKVSHFSLASFGTLFVHATIAYVLFTNAQALPKPALQEFIVTNVIFLDELKPAIFPENIAQETPLKPNSIVKENSQKSVKKIITKSIIQEPIQEPTSVRTTSTESLAESKVETKEVSKEQKSAFSTTLHQSDDLIAVYLAKIRNKIQESLHYSSMAKKMGLEGETVVRFLIHSNGMVDSSSIKIAKPSGKAILDRNAIDAILEALPFEAPPKEDLEIVIPVVFKLKS